MAITHVHAALRSLWRRPGYGIAVIALMGLALAAVGGIVSVFHGLLYKPLPFPQQERLVTVGMEIAGMGRQSSLSIPMLDRFGSDVPAFDAVAGYRQARLAIDDAGADAVLRVARVEPGLLSLMGARPMLGRLFDEADAAQEAQGTVLLSWTLWQRQFGGSQDAVGRMLRLEGGDRRVIGVLPKGFGFPDRNIQAWLPMGFGPEDRAEGNAGLFTGLRLLARLRPGVEYAAAEAQMNAVAASLPALREGFRAGRLQMVAIPLRELWLGDQRGALELMLLAALLVWVVTSANLCNLAISRALARSRDMTIRACIGASAADRAWQALAEAVALALAGAGLGLALVPAMLALLRHFERLPLNTPAAFGVDAATVAAVLVLALATAVLIAAGVWTSWRRAATASPQSAGTRHTAGRGAQRVRQGLVVAQIAVSLALLAGIGLLVRSSQVLLAQEVGFDRHQLVIVDSAGLLPGEAGPELRAARLRAFVERAAALPGVGHVGVGSQVPFGHWSSMGRLSLAGEAFDESSPIAYRSETSADYFAAMGMPILRGRGFTPEETLDRAPVVIVDSQFVATHLADRDPIGQRLRFGGDPSAAELTIVGVVPTVKRMELDEQPQHVWVYQPNAWQQEFGYVVLRATAGVDALLPPLRGLVDEIAPDGSGPELTVMSRHIEETLIERTRLNRLLQVLGVVALLLSAVGLYAVTVQVVRQRTAEFGVRMAIGATPRRIGRSVLSRASLLLALGVLLGLPLVWLAARSLSAHLFGVAVLDPLALGSAVLLLAAAVLLAAWWPARWAARIDPQQALRSE